MDSVAIVETINGVINVITVIGLFYVGSKASKIDELEERLDEKQTARINEKFVDLQRRLDEGDGEFNSMAERNHRVELRIECLVGEFKEFVRTTCASREDLKEHEKSVSRKFEHFEAESRKTGEALAVIAASVRKGAA